MLKRLIIKMPITHNPNKPMYMMLWNLLDVISWVAVIWLTYSIVDYFKSEPPLVRGGSDCEFSLLKAIPANR